MNVFQRVGIGLQAWYDAWFVTGGAEAIAPQLWPQRRLSALEFEPEPKKQEKKEAKLPKPTPTPASARSDALTLLELLQREGRLVDFLQEDISAYDDAQIGAAVRDVHRECARLLEKTFGLKPVLAQMEGESVELDSKSQGRIRLVGNVREGLTHGTLVHAGWRAEKVELPKWSGNREAERVVAPAEVEV